MPSFQVEFDIKFASLGPSTLQILLR